MDLNIARALVWDTYQHFKDTFRRYDDEDRDSYMVAQIAAQLTTATMLAQLYTGANARAAEKRATDV